MLPSVTLLEGVNRVDDTRVEGIKMKFNNEQSSVLLTLNELDSLVFNLRNMDVDSVALLLYLNYINKPAGTKNFNANALTPKVDIAPKESEFKTTDVPF